MNGRRSVQHTIENRITLSIEYNRMEGASRLLRQDVIKLTHTETLPRDQSDEAGGRLIFEDRAGGSALVDATEAEAEARRMAKQ